MQHVHALNLSQKLNGSQISDGRMEVFDSQKRQIECEGGVMVVVVVVGSGEHQCDS